VAYAARLAVDESPAQGREVLTPEQRQVERVLLGIRLREGHPLADVIYPDAAAAMVDEGLLDKVAFDVGRVALTLPGRLLADAVVRRLV
jgi:coproporphyrinogen III oxidase-like Fe-S oxidoreductase